MLYYNFRACVILCLQFVEFDSSASFKIVPRLENFSGLGPAARFKGGPFFGHPLLCFIHSLESICAHENVEVAQFFMNII